jgi:hypothetical protein
MVENAMLLIFQGEKARRYSRTHHMAKEFMRLRIGKPLSHRQMASQSPILCDQVLVAEQQILIHQPRLRTPGGVPSGIDRAW